MRSAALAAALGLAGCFPIFGEPTHTLGEGILSPDGTRVAVLDEVGTGATDGFVTWLLLHDPDTVPDPDLHRVAVLEGQGETVTWRDANTVVVSGSGLEISNTDGSVTIVID